MKESPRRGLFSLAYIYYKNLKSKSQMFFVLFQIFHKIIWQKKVSQNRQGLLFHGFMCLWLRNSGLRPSDSLAMTAHFISWNDTILSDVLLIPFPAALSSYQISTSLSSTISQRFCSRLCAPLAVRQPNHLRGTRFGEQTVLCWISEVLTERTGPGC